jgi:hypothetical protein
MTDDRVVTSDVQNPMSSVEVLRAKIGGLHLTYDFGRWTLDFMLP